MRCCDLRYIPPRQGAIDHFTGMVALHRKIAQNRARARAALAAASSEGFGTGSFVATGFGSGDSSVNVHTKRATSGTVVRVSVPRLPPVLFNQ